jgi:Ca2+:H+ antiporter
LTEGNIRSSIESRRRIELNEGLGGIEHAETLPASASTDRTNPRADGIEDIYVPEQSTRSQDTVVASQGATNVEDGGPRRRKIKELFKSGQSDTNTLSTTETEKSVPDKQKFTAVGQLKATILNSWINVLLVAAPVGSMANRPIQSSSSSAD